MGSLQAAPSSKFASGLWESSWASLQGIASNLIGSDGSGRSTPNRSPTRKRRPYEATHGTRNTSAPPAQWGPAVSGDRQLGAGTREDRKAQVQAKKREVLLAANGAPDTAGRYKRRDSDDRNRTAAENEDQNSLVYLHKVKPEDTLAGITIRYNCQANIFRKANRLWPNDSIQIRKMVVLPVDACGVRGRKIPEPAPNGALPHPDSFHPSSEDIMPTPIDLTTHPPWGDVHETNPKKSDKQKLASSIPTSPSISITLSNPEEPPWTHDSWVKIDNFPDAVEIARLSRKALGYFPRSRRKSLSFSDLGSPLASFDLPRPSYQSTTGSPRRKMSNAGSKSRSGSVSYFAKGLQGVGGVGTMSSNVRSPGPAQDGLNKMFAAHLPNVAPKRSFESLHSNTSHGNGGIENVGGAIEGWVRKIATKASTSLQPPTPGGRSGVGDLIELSEDAFELGGDEDEEDEESKGRRNTITGWSAKQQDQMLHERFPPRGRVFDESSRRGKPN